MLSQLASGTKPDEIAIKINLGQWHLIIIFLRKIIFTET